MKQVFIHGLGQTPSSWENTIRLMANEQDILCPDLPSLVKGKQTNYNNLYRAFVRWCSEVNGTIDLCGLSLGGVMALNMAIDHPDKVNSLVLIATQYKMPKRLLQIQNVLFRFMPKSTFQQTGFGKSAFILLCESMMDLDFSKELSKVSCPTMVIYGEKDAANRRASEELATNIANAELYVVTGAGHEINIDSSDRLAEILQSFYSRI